MEQRERDECLEQIWNARESGKPLEQGQISDSKAECLEQLLHEGFIVREGTRIDFAPRGEEHTRGLIRSHRIAERLIHDVLGGDFESAACEFEHTVNTELVDALCTLLGHPRECPHGSPIPEGMCCQRSDQFAKRSIAPLTELQIGLSARIAYVCTKSDQQLHRLDGLQLRPGSTVKLHQAYPSYVVECEGASIALDTAVAANIHVWLPDDGPVTEAGEEESPRQSKGRSRGFQRRRRRRI